MSAESDAFDRASATIDAATRQGNRLMGFRWPHQYVVSGRGEFRADMLRYDEADFLSLADETVAKMGVREHRRVKVIGDVEPTIRRWESLGWTVSHVEPLARKSRHKASAQ